MHPHRLHQRQQFDAAAAARRRQIALFLERLEQLQRTPARILLTRLPPKLPQRAALMNPMP